MIKINNITENVIFHDRLINYFNDNGRIIETSENGVRYNTSSPIIHGIGKEKMNFVDDYFGDVKVHFFENVKLRIGTDLNSTWCRYPVAIDENEKIINISNKLTSYFTIISYPDFSSKFILPEYNHLKYSSEFIEIEEEVFLFFDCFPFAPVHNLDDIYNLLYYYKKNNFSSKLLVLKTDNFYYNQSLESLKKYFNLEYIYIDFEKNYKFKKFSCVRPYHFIQDQPLEFIKENYIKKIIEDNKGKPTYDNVSIIKVGHSANCSYVDTFQIDDRFTTLSEDKKIFDANSLIEDMEYKIYVINNAKNIIVSYLSPFNVNIHKHCLVTEDKNFVILNGGYGGSFTNQFIKIGENKYDFYGQEMNGIVIDDRISLGDLTHLINF